MQTKPLCETWMCEGAGVADMETIDGFILTVCEAHKADIKKQGGQEI